MAMRQVKPFAILVLFLAAACTTPYRPIPPGTYQPQAGEERIVVTSSRIWFHVNVDRDNPDVIGSWESHYDVQPDGRIHFLVSSNHMFGIRLGYDYDWLWRAGKIIKIDLESDKITEFSLRN